MNVEATVHGNVINIHEYYDGDPAKCSCYYRNSIIINNLDVGDYDVQIWKDYLGLMHSTSVTVYDTIGIQGEVDSSQEVEYFSTNSGCLD